MVRRVEIAVEMVEYVESTVEREESDTSSFKVKEIRGVGSFKDSEESEGSFKDVENAGDSSFKDREDSVVSFKGMETEEVKGKDSFNELTDQ